MTRGEAIKDFFCKTILPVAAAALLYCIFRSACVKTGELDYHDYGYIVEENWKPDFGQLRETKVCEKDGYYRLRKIEQRLSILYSPYQQVSPILRKRVRGHNGFYGRQYKTTIMR